MPRQSQAKPGALVRIHGRGRATAKPQVAIRVRRSVQRRIEALVEGAKYNAYDYVLERGLEAIGAEGRVIDVDARALDEPDEPDEQAQGGR